MTRSRPAWPEEYPVTMRAIALVVAVVLASIGIGVGLVGGITPYGIPNAWVPVYDGSAQMSAPPTWTIKYNPKTCALPWNHSVIYVYTTITTPCPAGAAGPSDAPDIIVFRYDPRIILSGYPNRIINGVPVWTYGGGPGVWVPTLGIMMYASGVGVDRVLDTLTKAPA